LFCDAHLLYNSAGKGKHMNGEPQRDGQLGNSQLVTSKDNHRDGRPLLTLVPEYIPAEVSLENLGYFTPSSKRVKDIYVKEKVLGYKRRRHETEF
jgi:hypothetical protein